MYSTIFLVLFALFALYVVIDLICTPKNRRYPSGSKIIYTKDKKCFYGTVKRVRRCFVITHSGDVVPFKNIH